ncbi:SsgA family sporulation/cell division regulator [Streptomyces sp. NPDC007988]|uniref:SsgA family sporulation/cell division regulator n=1 Tax=Streptomyces sp. NPDC007988 TaxID=3364802 RepID=UPI0036E52C60
MDHLAATDDAEFDALLGASSLGAPHVVAELSDIPATARRRMAQAVRRQQRSLGMPDGTPHPDPDEADSCPEASTDTARTAQEVDPILPWRRPLTLLHMSTGTGKSTMLTVLAWLHRAHVDTAWGSTPKPPTLRLLNESATTSLTRRFLWWSSMLGENPGPGTLRHGFPHADPATLPGWRHTPALVDMAASAFHSTCDEAQTAPFATLACTQTMPLLSPDTGTGPSPALHASGWAGAWWHKPRPRNLQHLIEPCVRPDEPLLSVTPAGLFVCAVPSPHLRIVSFANSAYRAVGCGLLLPKSEGASRPSRPVHESGKAGHDQRRPRAGTATPCRTPVDVGARELSAELPMALHIEERESLELTSSLHTRLTYRVSDPYAIEARFRADAQDETVWIFGRELLRNGLRRSSGLGDVIVWPDTGERGERRIFFRLSSPEGTALLSAADAELRAFLDATSSLVGYGSESSYLVPAMNALETTMGELARPGRCD